MNGKSELRKAKTTLILTFISANLLRYHIILVLLSGVKQGRRDKFLLGGWLILIIIIIIIINFTAYERGKQSNGIANNKIVADRLHRTSQYSCVLYISPGSNLSKMPQCSVRYLSLTRPPRVSETYETDP